MNRTRGSDGIHRISSIATGHLGTVGLSARTVHGFGNGRNALADGYNNALTSAGIRGLVTLPSVSQAQQGGSGMSAMQIVRNADLEPAWTVKQAKEPGFMRSLITWVAGPEGYINTNPVQAARSPDATIGLMRMPVGNRQAGVHVHSVTEIYVILKGEAESFDGVGNLHRAGPMDCLYIPQGVPHGVRTVGDTDLELIWLHDAIERNGVSVYLDGPGPFPAADEVRLISFRDMEPDWGQADAKLGGTLRWVANWVAAAGGANHNPGTAQVNDTLALGVTAILPGNMAQAHDHPFAETYVIMSGTAAVRQGDRVEHLGRLDGVRFEPGTSHSLRNTGDQTLYLLWAHEKPAA